MKRWQTLTDDEIRKAMESALGNKCRIAEQITNVQCYDAASCETCVCRYLTEEVEDEQ